MGMPGWRGMEINEWKKGEKAYLLCRSLDLEKRGNVMMWAQPCT